MKHPDLNKLFLLVCDASRKGIGSVLLQEENGEEKPVANINKNFSKHKIKYAITEFKGLAIVWSLQKLERLL